MTAPVFPGRHPRYLRECSVEAALALESGLRPDFRERGMGLLHKLCGILHPKTIQILTEIRMQPAGKNIGKIVFIGMEFMSQRFQVQILLKMLHNIAHHPAGKLYVPGQLPLRERKPGPDQGKQYLNPGGAKRGVPGNKAAAGECIQPFQGQ